MSEPPGSGPSEARDRSASESGAGASAHEAGENPTAEEVAEEWAGRVARWTVRGLARAREEAEDIWAEAQRLRRTL